MIKKLFISLVSLAGVIGLSAVSAAALDAQYTDIGTYINNYPISGYAVDGKIVVVAEDLRYYGFDVNWDPANRALHINRNNTTQLYRKNIYKSTKATGSKFADIIPSDVKVDYNGSPITGYALNGYMLIPINDFAACAGSDEWDNSTRSYKIWIDGINSCDFTPIAQRCRNLWYKVDYNNYMPDLDFWEDMDCDGVSDHVSLTTKTINSWNELSATLKVNGSSTGDFLDGKVAYVIEAVYIMDIEPADNAKEIAVFSNCESDDPIIQIFRYSKNSIKPINFSYWNDWEGTVIDSYYWTGYVDAFPFDLHDDGTFTLQLQTKSAGMWDVYKTFRIDEYGNIVLIPQSTYIVAPNSAYRANQWGYYQVNKTIKGRGLTLYKGDWIKPLYDDCNNNIYIQKSNGSGGWFAIDGYNYGYGDEYSSMFALAG